LETGIRKSSQPEKRERQLAALLGAARVLPFDRACASEAAGVRAVLGVSDASGSDPYTCRVIALTGRVPIPRRSGTVRWGGEGTPQDVSSFLCQ
jgi:hypothetical protein